MSVGTGSIKRAAAKADKMEAPKAADLATPEVRPEEMPQVQPNEVPQAEPEVKPQVEPKVAQTKKKSSKPKEKVVEEKKANEDICQLTEELPVYLL